MNNPPPPRTHKDPYGLPDYYLGMLIDYDAMSSDNCKWVVYDGNKKVRCPTRKDACNYIASRAHDFNDESLATLIYTRILLNKVIMLLDEVANVSEPLNRLRLQKTAVNLRPTLVELDNIILPKYLTKNEHNERTKERDRESTCTTSENHG